MKSVLLIGLGRFGRHIARKLNELGHEVMAVDRDEELVNAVLPFVTAAQIGDSTNAEFLGSLGVRNFDACIVTIGDDFQSSLETVYQLKELGASRVIARAAQGIQEKFLLRNGADEVVYPEKQLAAWTAIRCTAQHILDYIEVNGDYSIYEVQVPPDWSGKTVLQLDIRRKFGLNILGVRRAGQLEMNVTADTLLTQRDSILVLGHDRDLQKCFKV